MEELNAGTTWDAAIAKWDQICGRSFKIFLQEGEDEFKEVAQLEDVQPKTLNHS